MKISTSKTEVDLLHLSRNSISAFAGECSDAKAGKEVQVRYLVFAFTSDGRHDEELVTRIAKPSAVMRDLHYLVVMKRELKNKASFQFTKQSSSPFFGNDQKSAIRSAGV